MNNVNIISTVGVPANYGGYETFVEHLIECTSDQVSYTVYCSSARYKDKLETYKNAKLRYLPLDANGAQGILYDSLSVLLCWFRDDTILSLGTGGAWLYPLLRKLKNTRVITNFDGMDDEREKWNSIQQLILRYNRKCAAKYSDICVADNQAMAERISKKFHVRPVVIGYGADHVKTEKRSDFSNKMGIPQAPYALAVLRIVPENNVELICEAAKNSKMPIVIVGNWNVSDWSKKLRERFENNQGLVLLEGIYDQRKLDEIRSNCAIYIHGHSKGGTNPSLVEAMYLGLPIFAFDVEFNRVTTADYALFFSTSDDLVEKINEAKQIKLDELANQAQKYAEENYTWDKIRKHYEALY